MVINLRDAKVVDKEILRLKLIPRSQVEKMAEMLAVQSRRLRELEAKLHKEKQEKANLEIDFQHLLDQVRAISHGNILVKDPAVVCG